MVNVTILGASGMLGKACSAVLPAAYKPTREEFDALRDEPKFNGWIINCIGAIPQKIKDPETMWRLNADFPKKLVTGKVIQITTDCIFSGKSGNYDEFSMPDPVDDYGKSKLAGEVARSFKIRCSIVGPETSNASLFEWVRQQPVGATLHGYADHYWNGVSTEVFAKLAKGLIEAQTWRDTTLHLVPRDIVSKYDLVKMIAIKTGRSDLTIKKFETGQPVNRTLTTSYPDENERLWELAGFSKIPTIEQIINEISI